MKEMRVSPRPLAALTPALGPERAGALRAAAEHARKAIGGRTIWQINSTGAGGGVAELATALLPYVRDAGIDVRWLVIEGDQRFFDITKRMCLILYGNERVPPVSDDDLQHFHAVLAAESTQILPLLAPGDLVVLHDPQTVGLISTLTAAGATVVWRCHIGSDHETGLADDTWRLLRPQLEQAGLLVFSTPRHIPGMVNASPAQPVRIIHPSINPLTPKNRHLDAAQVAAILTRAGLLDGVARTAPPVPRLTWLTERRRLPEAVPFVAQISRWDPLKDMAGVMESFAAHVDEAHLVLAGPDVAAIADDPGAAAALDDCLARWRLLPPPLRRRVHLVTVPMADVTGNALVINALQRRAALIAQKSLAEGFGLTVTEAMWKARPVVASGVGGITEQITAEHEGILVDDPRDLAAFGTALARPLRDPGLSARLGDHAHRRVQRDFLPDRHLMDWAGALATLSSSDARAGLKRRSPGRPNRRRPVSGR